MKKVFAILGGIGIIVMLLWGLYRFVLLDIVDPPPESVMRDAIDAAKEWVGNDTRQNEDAFVSLFSADCRERLEREWAALNLQGFPRGSWYDLADGLLNSDSTRPEVIGEIDPPPASGEEEEAEGEEEEDDEEGEELEAWVRIRRDRSDLDIPFVRDEGAWRIDLPSHPASVDGS